ncbi:MAG: hypothetical protein IJ213_00070 [Bacteroidales bacterium]|nr:hypothetical protein [Bacteroidales bacterium]
MKRLALIILTLFCTQIIFSQTEVKNGVVIDHTAEKIVKNTVAKLKNDTPFSFSFSYNLSFSDKTTEKGSGTFLSNNDKYKIETTNFSDYCNGTTYWHYVKANEEVEISDIEEGNSMFNFTKIINQFSNSYGAKLIRYEVFNKVNCAIIDLTPTKKSAVSKIRLYTSKTNNTVSKIIIYTYEGTTYTYTFTNYKSKIQTQPTDFTFPKSKYPKAKTVDLR